jgi:hypothetical protein
MSTWLAFSLSARRRELNSSIARRKQQSMAGNTI